MSRDVRHTAVHESAHAVIAVVLGFSVVKVSMGDGKWQSGTTRIVFDHSRPADVMVICFAGSIAESIVFGSGLGAMVSDSDGDMIYQAVARIDQPGEHLSVARLRAFCMVNEHLGAIREVARLLMARGELYPAELMAALPQLEAAA